MILLDTKLEVNNVLYGKNNMPPLIERIKSFLREKSLWEKAGKPIRDEKEIKRIYDEYCAICEFLIKDKLGNTKCNICGCFINRGTVLNKIAWGTTRCPHNPPKWIEEVKEELNKEEIIKIDEDVKSVAVQKENPQINKPAENSIITGAARKKCCH